MGREFPNPKGLHHKHFPESRFSVSVRYETMHPHDSDNFIGGIPKGIEYMRISLARGSWNSDTWEEMEEAYKNEGYNVHLRKTSGTTRTKSGICKHAPTSMYVW